MPSYKDYIHQGQQYVNAAQANDPAYQEWYAKASATPFDGYVDPWMGTDYWDQWLKSLTPEQQADYIKQSNDSTRWQNKVGDALKVA